MLASTRPMKTAWPGSLAVPFVVAGVRTDSARFDQEADHRLLGEEGVAGRPWLLPARPRRRRWRRPGRRGRRRQKVAGVDRLLLGDLAVVVLVNHLEDHPARVLEVLQAVDRTGQVLRLGRGGPRQQWPRGPRPIRPSIHSSSGAPSSVISPLILSRSMLNRIVGTALRRHWPRRSTARRFR